MTKVVSVTKHPWHGSGPRLDPEVSTKCREGKSLVPNATACSFARFFPQKRGFKGEGQGPVEVRGTWCHVTFSWLPDTKPPFSPGSLYSGVFTAAAAAATRRTERPAPSTAVPPLPTTAATAGVPQFPFHSSAGFMSSSLREYETRFPPKEGVGVLIQG